VSALFLHDVVVSFTFILCSVFRSPGNASPSEVKLVMNHITGSGIKASIHAETRHY
jgi:hypothetical protein